MDKNSLCILVEWNYKNKDMTRLLAGTQCVFKLLVNNLDQKSLKVPVFNYKNTQTGGLEMCEI